MKSKYFALGTVFGGVITILAIAYAAPTPQAEVDSSGWRITPTHSKIDPSRFRYCAPDAKGEMWCIQQKN